MDKLKLGYIRDYIRKYYLITSRFLIYKCYIEDYNIHIWMDIYPYSLDIKIDDYNIYLRQDKINKLKEKINTQKK